MKKLILLFLALLIYSCGQGTKSGAAISTDIQALGKQLDFKKYKPKSVAYKAGEDEFSDLEAVLYFDSETFKKLQEEYAAIDYTAPGYKTADFNFSWLDENVKKELTESPKEYSGHPDMFFGENGVNKLWILNDKVLILHHSHKH